MQAVGVRERKRTEELPNCAARIRLRPTPEAQSGSALLTCRPTVPIEAVRPDPVKGSQNQMPNPLTWEHVQALRSVVHRYWTLKLRFTAGAGR